MTEAVPLGELLHEEALCLTGIRKWVYPEDGYSRLDFASRHISNSLGVARPFTNKVEKGRKKCTDLMVGRARLITLYDGCTPSSASSTAATTQKATVRQLYLTHGHSKKKKSIVLLLCCAVYPLISFSFII